MDGEQELAEVAEYIATSPYMRFIMAFRAASALCGFAFVAAMLTQWRTFVAHVNLMLALAVHVVWVLLACVAVAAVDLAVLWQQLTFSDAHDLILSGRACFAWRFPHALALLGVTSSLIIIAGERLLATVIARRYEACGKTAGVITAAAQVAFPIAMTAWGSLGYSLDGRFAFCSIITPGNMQAMQYSCFVFLILEIVALFLFHCSLRVNRRKIRRHRTARLAERYQATENLRTLRMITPLVWCHLLWNLGSIGGWLTYTVVNNGVIDPRTYPMLEESVNLIHLHSFTLPIALFFRHRQERASARRLLRANGVGDAASAAQLTNVHLEMIERAWSARV